MLRSLRQYMDTRGVYIRRASRFEGFDPYIDLRKLRQPGAGEVAFDVGANCGQTVEAIRRVFPLLPVHSFEPVAASLADARIRCAGYQDVAFVQAAVGAQAGEITLYSQGASQLTSLRDIEPTAGAVANHVPVVTIDDYVLSRGITSLFLLKTDTEGFDLGVLQGAQRMLAERRIGAVVCEVGFSRRDLSHSHFPDILGLLEERGLVLAGLYDLSGFSHLRQWGYMYGNALFIRRDAETGILG